MPAGEAAAAPPRVSALRYALVAACFSALWASAFVAIKIALRDCPPFFMMSSRFLLAGAGLLAWAALSGARWPADAREWRRIAVLGLLNNALYLGINAVNLRHMDSGMGALLASTNPLLLALVAPWALRERLTLTKGVGLLISYSGVAWVMRSRIGPHNEPWAMASFLGTVAFIVTATVLFKRWRLSAGLAVITGGQSLVAGLVLLVPALAFESVADVRWTWAFALAQGYMILVVSTAAMLIWFWLLTRGDATRASAYFFLNPIFGLLLGAALLAERLGLADLAGTAAVALGIYLVQRAR